MGQLKESGFKHDLETYMSVIRLLCHWDWGKNFSSDILLHDVIDNTNWEVGSFEISDKLFDALIDEKLIEAVEGLVQVYATAVKFEEAIHALSEMKIRSGLMASTRTCNFVLRELIEWEKEDIVESVYGELKRIGLIPDKVTYGMLMTGICRKGCLKEAWKVIEEMEQAGVKPDAYIYSNYIFGLCLKRKTEIVFQVLKNFGESKRPVDAWAYGCVIRGFATELNLKDAEDVFLEMKLRQVVPDAGCYESLIEGYCWKGDTDKALDLCKEMELRGIEADRVFVRNLMKFLCTFVKLDEAVCLFKHFMQQSRVFLDQALFNMAIDAACKLGKMDDAMAFVEEMKDRNIKPLVVQAQGLETTGFQGQWVQPNVGQDEGVESVPDARVQSEGIQCLDGVVQDARDQATVGQLHTTQQTPALHKLTSLNARHAVILKKFRKSKRICF